MMHCRLAWRVIAGRNSRLKTNSFIHSLPVSAGAYHIPQDQRLDDREAPMSVVETNAVDSAREDAAGSPLAVSSYRYPTGWYIVAWASDVAPGAVPKLHYFGQDMVCFR